MLFFEIVSSYSVCKVIVFFGFSKGVVRLFTRKRLQKCLWNTHVKRLEKLGILVFLAVLVILVLLVFLVILELDDFYALLCAELQTQFLQLELLDLAASR